MHWGGEAGNACPMQKTYGMETWKPALSEDVKKLCGMGLQEVNLRCRQAAGLKG